MTSRLYDTYTKIYKMSLLTKSQLDNNDNEKIKGILETKFNTFKSTDLPAIESDIIKYQNT